MDLKRGINHFKAKEFVEKKLLVENEKLRNEIKSKIDEIENLREYKLKMSELSGTYGNIDMSQSASLVFKSSFDMDDIS